MKKEVLLTIRGCQNYPDQEPEVIELLTEGTLSSREDGWLISYEETELTGMKGVLTTFQLQPGVITLTRSGALSSQMIFQEGVTHESLYQTDFGFAMMIAVRAEHMRYDISPEGGTVDLTYGIEIEQTTMGTIEYHLEIRSK